MRRFGLSTRIFAGFLVLVVVFGAASAFAVVTLRAARRDLVVLTRGYLSLGRAATQLRTLQELKDATVARAVAEGDTVVRRPLVGFSRELYPQAMRERLDEIQSLARQLQGERTTATDALFLETVFAQARRARDLAAGYDDATNRLLDVVDASVADNESERAALVEDWKRRSEGYSRELRAIALGVDTRAADALLRVERAEAQSAWWVVVVGGVALVVGALVLVMMLRALRPLKSLADATRALQQGAGAADVAEVLAGAVGRDARVDDDVAVLGRELLALATALDERNAALAQRSRELLRLGAFAEDVVRSVRSGIVVVDDGGRVRTLNPAARSVFGLPLVDVEGRELRELVDAASLGGALPLVDEVRRAGALRALPLVKVKDKVVDIAVVPLRDRAGSSGGDVLLLGDDVTAREDARERLVQSERLAAIGRLAAQITHEIRNPLSSIGLNIELLGDDVENLPEERQAEVRAILDAVLAEVRRLAEITEGYLRFARLPAPQKTDTDVGDLCAGLVAFTQGEAASRGVNIELHVDQDLPAVAVDADRLRQALLNLLRNGLDAAGKGGTVRVSARGVHGDDGEEGSGVDVVVEDNGPGVAAEAREKIFSPFFTTKKEGTGLGLVVAREIVREHRGDLTIGDGALGGAAFRVHLPAAAPPPGASSPSSSSPSSSSPSSSSPSSSSPSSSSPSARA